MPKLWGAARPEQRRGTSLSVSPTWQNYTTQATNMYIHREARTRNKFLRTFCAKSSAHLLSQKLWVLCDLGPAACDDAYLNSNPQASQIHQLFVQSHTMQVRRLPTICAPRAMETRSHRGNIVDAAGFTMARRAFATWVWHRPCFVCDTSVRGNLESKMF